MAEVSVGRAVAVASLVPLARQLADERERREAETERRRELNAALAGAPPIEPPAAFAPARDRSLHERTAAMVAWTVVLFVPVFWLVNAIPAWVNHHHHVGYANPWLALLFAAMLGFCAGGLPHWRALYRRDREEQRYRVGWEAARAREAERATIRAQFGPVD
jgi:hypothetical protein